tara:strand:+ start:51011 stop:51775 length:765 start_codon:yes stop_codon:yes gene_type:complete
MKRIVSLIVALTLYLIPFYGSTQAEELVDIYGNGDLPPINFHDDGVITGLGYELIKAIFHEAGIASRINFVPWNRAYYNGLKGNGVVFGIAKTTERELIFDYSTALWTESFLLVTAKGNEFNFNSIDDLKGRVIVMQQGARPSNRFNEYLDKGVLSVVFNRTPQSRLKFILAGRADVGIFNPGLDAVKMNVLAAGLSMDQFSILDLPVAVSKKYIAVKKRHGSKSLINKINQAISRLKSNGVMDKIKNKYNIEG